MAEAFMMELNSSIGVFMRWPSLVVAVPLFVWPLNLLGQEVTHSMYIPPPTLEQMMVDDPTFGGANLWRLAADPPNFRAIVEQQAASGKLVAQMLLGETYIPPECTFLPFKIAPGDCPQDPKQPNLLGLTPSFDLAIHWLTLASEQGNGEASEILAQVIERAIRSSNASHYQMAEVARYHAFARSQGFDLQDDEISCYSLDPSGPADRLIMAAAPAEYQLTPQELDSLHAAGASGTLRWGGDNIRPGWTNLLQHPEGPRVHTRVILGAPASHELLVPMGNRVDVTYLQQGDRIVTIPSTYPALRRVLSIRPPTADEPAAALLQGVDGQFGGCATRTFPSQSGLPKP
jgi:hypothetical protein